MTPLIAHLTVTELSFGAGLFFAGAVVGFWLAIRRARAGRLSE
jgi:hypothetical protein